MQRDFVCIDSSQVSCPITAVSARPSFPHSDCDGSCRKCSIVTGGVPQWHTEECPMQNCVRKRCPSLECPILSGTMITWSSLEDWYLVVAVPAVEVGVGLGSCSHLLWYCATRTGGGRQCSLECHFLFVVLPT